MKEHYCPYCRAWINDTVHRQHHHNDLDKPDEQRDWRVRLNGVVYEDEEQLELYSNLNPLLKQAIAKAKGGGTNG